MSKERARRREERDREAAIRTAARAAEQERRERRLARRRSVTGKLPVFSATGRNTGRQSGVLAHRRRVRTGLLLVLLVALNVLVWVLRPDWEARLGALVFTVLAAPLLAGLVLRSR